MDVLFGTSQESTLRRLGSEGSSCLYKYNCHNSDHGTIVIEADAVVAHSVLQTLCGC